MSSKRESTELNPKILKDLQKFDAEQLLTLNWIKSCTIEAPEQKIGYLKTHTVFQIHIELDLDEPMTYSIYRRYNDFKAFRSILRQILPCHFIRPLHVDKLLNFEKEMVKQ